MINFGEVPWFQYMIIFCMLIGLPMSMHSQDTGKMSPCPVDTTQIVVLAAEDFLSWRTDFTRATEDPSIVEIELTECLLDKRIARWNKRLSEKQEGQQIDPTNYFRQYCAVADRKGHRLIYLNAFCPRHSDDPMWLKNFKTVLGGGSCYFQALFDLTNLKTIEFSVNDVE